MQWRLAKTLEVLRSEVNAKYPTRSRDSDGSIGDAAHASRSSDHNPWVTDPPGPNVVTAIDITHDPAHGFDSYAFAEWLRTTRDPRIKYVISNRRIFSSDVAPWQWRAYGGTNPHDHHVHISVKPSKALFDTAKPWGVNTTIIRPSVPAQVPTVQVPPTLRLGASGDDVKLLQLKLDGRGIPTVVDGNFGHDTEASVMLWQMNRGLKVDGIVGPQTWKSLSI